MSSSSLPKKRSTWTTSTTDRHNDYSNETTMMVYTVCNTLRRKPKSSLSTTSHPQQQSPQQSSRRGTSDSKNQFRNVITVKLLCRCSVLLMLYNLLLLIIVIFNNQKSNIRLDSITWSNYSPMVTEESFYQSVRQTAFTNMLPPTQNIKKGKTRRTKKSKESSLSLPVTMNLYDIYNDPVEVSQRSMRFPSMEQRLKVYLSTWYIPPCPNSSSGKKVQYNYQANQDMKKGMVVFQPLHVNNTLSTSSTSMRSFDTLMSQQQRRQLRSMFKKGNEKIKQKLPILSEINDATVIPNNLIYTVDTRISHERHLILYNPNVMENCDDPFCEDVIKFIQPSLNRILSLNSSLPSSAQPAITTTATYTPTQHQIDAGLKGEDEYPVIFQFGDAELYRSYVPSLREDVYSPMVPVLRKYRYSITPSDLQQITSGRIAKSGTNSSEQQEPLQCYSSEDKRIIAGTVRNPTPKTQAIISIVSNYPRHFEPLNHVNDADIAWEKKLNMAVYRGALTGRNKADYKSSDLKFCVQVPRCNLVYQHGNSSLVDAMLVPYGKMKYPLSDPLNGVKMFGNPMSMEEMLKYKAIVMLEGNDVSSGLKWALFSNSVVLTQTPTCTSWAMEELLVPWVHYVPINDDLSDVEEKVQWILDHDKQARTIARNGRLWIADLIYHPDADNENEMIIDETLRRYRSHFVYNPSLLLLNPKPANDRSQKARNSTK